MADPVSPKPPRPPGQPPPLPPRPLVAEPLSELGQELPDTIRDYPPRRVMLPPAPEAAVPITVAPPSRRQQAARAVGSFAHWTTIAIGVLGIAAEVAAVFRPDLQGPIEFVRKLLQGLPQ